MHCMRSATVYLRLGTHMRMPCMGLLAACRTLQFSHVQWGCPLCFLHAAFSRKYRTTLKPQERAFVDEAALHNENCCALQAPARQQLACSLPIDAWQNTTTVLDR